MNTRSDWTYGISEVVYADETVEVITIIDKDLGNRSVTNDVENILEAIAKELPRPLHKYAITYFDSTDKQDEIIVDKDNKFLSFAALPRGRTSRFVKTEAARRLTTRRWGSS